ncbi:MAG: DUF4260 family protein [Gemmatimonadales bacterium]|nr:MAG: DUF4260 family protein [Gemmatimonadales bacterium]
MASNGTVGEMPRAWLRAEGLAAFGLTTGLYAIIGGPWWLYFVLLLAPDLAMLGYLGGPRLGATAYNLAHSYVGPVVLALIGVVTASAAFAVALIWCTHIGLDRMLGYGLKYPTAFGHTNLGLIGRKQAD